MKKLVLVFLLSIFYNLLFSQKDHMTLKGKVVDTSGEGLALASVMLLDPIDSSLLDYLQADEHGFFIFSSIELRPYLLKINYVSYIPNQIRITGKEKYQDLGKIKMTPISKELFEVVIKAAKAPMLIKGDTIEYDASTFKVPQGSTVEDLLRKLPGIEVDQQGSITADGKNVNRVTVDGKNFFGGDPKAATKNLPAEGIAKVQVFNDVTEEQKITGQRRINSDKAMNLELKEEFKKGGFGKIVAGLGTEETKEIKGNYNKFDSKNQFSVIGSLTNTGRNGLSWNDYQDFKGSNSFNWGDDGDFGFSNGGSFRFVIFDDGEDDDITGASSFFGSDNYGFPKKASAGVNYNYDNKRTKLSSMYFYDLNQLFSNAYRTQNLLYPVDPYNTLDTSSRDNKKMSHRLELRLEQEIDSSSSIVVKLNQSFGNRNTVIGTDLHNYDVYEKPLSDQFSNSDVTGNATNSQNVMIYRKKFRKKGRNMGLSTSYIRNNTERASSLQSRNDFYSLASIIDSVGSLNQNYNTNQTVNTFKANVLWSEPLTKKIVWRSFYNFANSHTDYSRLVGDYENNILITNQFLSRDFINTNAYNRLGSSLVYNYEGVTVNIGGAFQEIFLNSELTRLDSFSTANRNVYHDWIPNVELEYELRNGFEASVNYNRWVSAPNYKDLLPIVDNTNPLFIRLGNPGLQPKRTNEVGISIRKFNRLNFTNLYARFSYSYNETDVIYSTEIDSRRVNTTLPINVNGTRSANGNLNYGFPIVKNKFTINIGYNYNYRQDKTLVNGISDQPQTSTHGFNLRTNLTPIDNFTFFLNTFYRTSTQNSSITSNASNKVETYGGNAEMNIKFPKLFYFNSSFNLNNYNNKVTDFNTTIPILNLSVYKLFLKDNKGEIRLSAYDVFNKTVGIQQYISINKVIQTETLSLARYLMLSITYNMRGLKSNLEKGGRRGMMF